jgi:hypothetical protein
VPLMDHTDTPAETQNPPRDKPTPTLAFGWRWIKSN